MTLQTIADRVGVSRMTVSNAFSRPDQLSTQLRERILATARALGYVGPDPAARALARGASGAVGVLLTDSIRYAFTDEVATAFLGALADELAPTGLALTLLTSEERGDVVPARDLAVDGAVVYSCRAGSTARDWLVKRGLPLVFVDKDPAPGIACVNVDDRHGARLGARHLLDLGHRDIGIVTLAPDPAGAALDDDSGPTVPHAQRERMLGWREALAVADAQPTVEHAATHTDDDAEAAALRLLSSEHRPTAVLCFSDVLALGVARAAGQLGLQVPSQLSIVGFDDSPAASRHEPGITTIRQDVRAKGRLAAAALSRAIQAAATGSTPDAPHHLLPTELVVRASSGPAPGGRASG